VGEKENPPFQLVNFCESEAQSFMRSNRGVGFLPFVVLLLAAPVLWAQQTTGVNGIVSDASGAVVVGASVSLDNALSSVHRTTATNDQGFYQFLRLTPGDAYSLIFAKTGFETISLNSLTLGVSTVETHNVSLQVGSTSQTIEVMSEGEGTLNTTDASVGNVIDSRFIDELPSQYRLNPSNLLVLQAGVNDAGSITGARSDQGNITLDGLDINDEANGQAFLSTILVSIDSVREVRTITAGETADYGRSSGGGINMITKSGTNDWHGNAREYHRDTLLAANDWFNNRDGVARAPLIRNQFGASLGGPIKKNKLFFFFDYEGLRFASSENIERAVPTASFAAGNLSYINNGPGCDGTARLNTNPSCISTLTPTQVATLDPLGIGPNQALLAIVAARPYPRPNDPTGGDAVNSEGFRFTAPAHQTQDLYTVRFDYNLSSKNKLFFRGSVAREGQDDDFNTDIVQFPGDPAPNSRDRFGEYASSVGWSWAKSTNFINDLSVGLVRTVLVFPSLKSPTYPNQFIFTGPISNPYLPPSSQSRNVPVLELQDSATWTKGRHSMTYGTDMKLIRLIDLRKNDFSFISIGLSGSINQSLVPALRPTDINTADPTAVANWDQAFPFLLGSYASVNTNFYYNKTGMVLPSGTEKHRDVNYNEFEFYAQDSWKIRADLTLTYGLRWNYHAVPYEINGFQSVPSVNENTYFAARLNAAANGTSGNDAVPLVSYNLGGSSNHAPGYYNPDYKDFGPRVGLAYNPSLRHGMLSSIFGDRKTTLRLGGAILYDRVAASGVDQNTFLFDSSASNAFGVPLDPATSLATSPRFAGYNNFPMSGFFPAAPNVTAPSTPNLDANGNPIGTADFGGFPAFFQFDQNTKTPYAIVMNFGFQRELPGNFLLEANYVARLGRRLLAVGDAATITNFKDTTSGQLLKTAFGQLQNELAQLNAGTMTAVTPIPWFENQMAGPLMANYGLTCAQVGGCTNLVLNSNLNALVGRGDLSDTIQGLASKALLFPNVGLPAQTGANGYIGNYASSSYNGLLVSLRKRISKGLQFDFNYTYSHSIDNLSEIINNYNTNAGSGLICDLSNLRICRASSDFDARHVISANYIYDLPIGRGCDHMRDVPGWLNAIVGSWTWSGIVTWRTGYPFFVHTGAFPTAYTLDSPALVVGPKSALQGGIHTDSSGNLQFFQNANTALSALSFPQGGNVGDRNALTGPGFWNVDMGVAKFFVVPWSERQRLQFRWDSFNTFNHPSFNPPNPTLLNTSSFGFIGSTSSTPRVMQLALRFEF
jgi:Carboxypeptidase regulatory-like domain